MVAEYSDECLRAIPAEVASRGVMASKMASAGCGCERGGGDSCGSVHPVPQREYRACGVGIACDEMGWDEIR